MMNRNMDAGKHRKQPYFGITLFIYALMVSFLGILMIFVFKDEDDAEILIIVCSLIFTAVILGLLIAAIYFLHNSMTFTKEGILDGKKMHRWCDATKFSASNNAAKISFKDGSEILFEPLRKTLEDILSFSDNKELSENVENYIRNRFDF